MTTEELLAQLPHRGWGVLRAEPPVVFVIWSYGFIKVQLTPTRGVYQAQLTGAGRRWLKKHPPEEQHG